MIVPPPGFLTPKQAAKAWTTRTRPVARRTVVAWCALGLIPGARQMPIAYGRPASARSRAFTWIVPVTAKPPDVKRGRPLGAKGTGAPRTPERRQQMAATAEVNAALKRGELTRAGVCARCGLKARTDAHHHRGYAREHWLDIVWLCRPCHFQTHKGTDPIAKLAAVRGQMDRLQREERRLKAVVRRVKPTGTSTSHEE